MIRNLLISTILLLINSLAFAGQSYLVGDFGVIQDMRGILVARDKPMPVIHDVEPVVDHTQSVGEVKVEAVSVEFYDGKGNYLYEDTDKEAMERSGFYSIVTSTNKE